MRTRRPHLLEGLLRPRRPGRGIARERVRACLLSDCVEEERERERQREREREGESGRE